MRSHVAACVLRVACAAHTHTLVHTQQLIMMIMGSERDISANKGRLVWPALRRDAPAGLIRVEGFDSIRNCSRHAANCSKQTQLALSLSVARAETIGKPGRQPFALAARTFFFFFLFIYSPHGPHWDVAKRNSLSGQRTMEERARRGSGERAQRDVR